MSLNIKSPEFSFLEFGGVSHTICNDPDNESFYPLPVYKDFAIKSQVQIVGTPRLVSDKLYIAICGVNPAEDCNCSEDDIIINGLFDTDLSNWSSDDFIWNAGRAEFHFTTGCHSGSIRQEVPYKTGYFRVKFAYIAETDFDIILRAYDGATILEEWSIPAIADNRRHVEEIYYTATTPTTNNIQFLFAVRSQSRIPGAPVTDPCGYTGDAEDGFYFDSIEAYRTDICEKLLDEDIELTPVCSNYKWDVLEGDEEVDADDPYHICNLNPTGEELFTGGNFDNNPFNAISGDTLGFEMLTASASGTYFTLYLGEKIIVFVRKTSLTTINTGNLWIVACGTGSLSLFIARVKNFLQTVIDPLIGTTTTETSGVFSIVDVPVNSFLDDNNDNILSNIVTVGASSGLKVKNGYYNPVTKRIDYLNIITGDNGVYQRDITMVLNGYYKIQFNYDTLYSFNHKLRITNSSAVVVFDEDINPLPTAEGETIYKYFLCPANDTYKVELIFTPTNPTDQLSIDDISITDTPRIHVTSSVTTEGYVEIPDGYYSKEQLQALIEEILGIPFSCEFTSCCTMPKIQFTHTFPDEEVEYEYYLNQYWNVAQINFPEILMEGVVEPEECFKYCILDENKNVIACSNIFKRIVDECFTTVLEYWNNENALGFKYPNTNITNLIRLPLYLYGVDYPIQEKVYRQTNGRYNRLSTIIEKEYDAETDNLPEWLHDKIMVALKHDNVYATNKRVRLENEEVSQQGVYKPEWKEPTDIVAKAKFKIRKYFNGTNSNCKSSNSCS